MRTFTILLLAVLTTCATAQVFTDPDLKAEYERGREAYEKGQWGEALKHFEEILIVHPQRINLIYISALCLKNEKRTDEAIEKFKEIVTSHRNHILSNYQLALLYMSKPKPTQEDITEARRRLLEAAQYGFDAVGAIESEQILKNEFGSDVSFILELIRAPTAREKTTSEALVDPFKPLLIAEADVVDPVAVEVPEDTTEAPPSEVAVDLKKQRETLVTMLLLLDQIQERLHFQDEDTAEEIFREVEELVALTEKYGENYDDPELVALRRQALQKYNLIFKDILQVRVRRFEQQASAIVDQMRLHIETSEFARVETDFQELQRHLSSGNKDESEFQQVAEAWTKRGLKWLLISRKLREAASIQIQLSGVVFGKDSDRNVAQAIVNEQILAEGDRVRDVAGNPIADLEVKTIGKNYVRFHYDGVEFDWYMGLDTPIGFKYTEEE